MTDQDSIDPLNKQQRDALAALYRAAIAYVNASPLAELHGSEFPTALASGAAYLDLTMRLPAVPGAKLTITGSWPAAGIDRQRLLEFAVPRLSVQ